MKIARIVAVCAGLAIAFGMWTKVCAGTLPDISGTWYANGNPAAPCHISQSGTSVSLTNEQGRTASGSFVDPSTLSTDWGLLNGGQITGTVSNDLRTIRWGNGTYWSRRQNTAPGSYRLRTKFTGYTKCLDIINDGRNNRLTMATCGDYTGQRWTIEPIGPTGYLRLRTEFTGRNKCLDIINDGTNNRLTMATCGDYTGQRWTFEPIGSTGYLRLRTEFTGSSKCVDIINDGRNNRLTMATCGNFTGQMWRLERDAA
jgi:hypothetical protein